MHRSLLEHIANLEKKIEVLRERLAEPHRIESEQNDLQIDLGIAQRALVHFRKAYELEQKLSA